MTLKLRGFRLRRRLVAVWSPLSRIRTHCNTMTATAKLFDWGRRCFTRRLPSSFLAGGEYCRLGDRTRTAQTSSPLLEDHGESKPPKGHLAVYVGGRKEGGPPQRYMVPVIYFNHPLFGELLRETEAEYGFNHDGGITIPCPVSRFERVQSRIATEPCRRRRNRS